MAKKEWSDEDRKAFGAKMRAAKQAKIVPLTEVEQIDERPNDVPVDQPMVNSDYADLVRQMTELKAYMFDMKAVQSGAQVGAQGLIGTFEKYILSPDRYPSPTARLAKEARLQRFAFDMNYELDWNVGVSSYKTLDGINTKEPKFEIQLNRVIMDEETGLPTAGRYVISKAIFHEDPEAALAIASENNVPVDESNEKNFLDEMRYLRIRDWLIECFYTPLISQKETNKKEMVVGGKLIQYFEVSSENSAAIPFDQLKTKL